MQNIQVTIKKNTQFRSIYREDYKLQTVEQICTTLPAGTRVYLGPKNEGPIYILGKRKENNDNNIITYTALPQPENQRLITLIETTKYVISNVANDTLGLVKKLKCSEDFILINNTVANVIVATQLHSLDGNTELTINAGCDITLQ